MLERTHYMFDVDDLIIDRGVYSHLYPDVLQAVAELRNLSPLELSETIRKAKEKRNAKGKLDTYDLCEEIGCLDLYYVLFDKITDERSENFTNEGLSLLFKGIKEMKKKICIVSNDHHKTIRMMLKKFNLLDHVDIIFSRDQGGEKKNLEYWGKLIEKEDLVPEHCIVVGNDFQTQLKHAKRFGFRTIKLHEPISFNIMKYL